MAETPSALVIGCGYLGLEVARRLITRGWRVRGTSRREERLASLSAHGVEGVALDLARPGDSRAWDGRCTAAIYSVAPGRDGDPRLGFHDGALAALERVPLEGPFIYVSSTGVYAQSDGSEVDETSPAEPGETRHRWLRRAEEQVLSRPRPGVVLRVGGLYGPGRSPLEWVGRREFRARLGVRRGAAFMNWVHVEDAADAIALAVTRAPGGTLLDITDGSPVRRREFFGLAAELAGVEPIAFDDGAVDLGKRCTSRRARGVLGFAPRYPSFREGLTALAG